VKPGDLVVPWHECTVTDNKEPTFFSRGRSRDWKMNQIATIVAESTRNVRGHDVLKFQILLDGELWWTGAGAARLLEPNETR